MKIHLNARTSILIAVIIVSCTTYFLGTRYHLWVEPLTTAEQIYRNCMKQMQDDTCAVMSGPNAEYLPPDVKDIMIAGFGSLSANLYKDLRKYPTKMCGQIKESCESAETNELCRLGRVLYLAAVDHDR